MYACYILYIFMSAKRYAITTDHLRHYIINRLQQYEKKIFDKLLIIARERFYVLLFTIGSLENIVHIYT